MLNPETQSGFSTIDSELIPIFAQCPALKTDEDFIYSLRAMTHEYPWPCYFTLLALDEAAIRRTNLYLRNTSRLSGILNILRRYAARMRARIGHENPSAEDLQLYDLGYRFLIRVAYNMVDYHRRYQQTKRSPQPLF